MKKYFLPVILVTCFFMTVAVPVLTAYDDSNDGDEEEFSPWAAWRKGFSYFEKAERSREKGEQKKALAFYKKARQCYFSVKKARPKWNQQIIGSRIKMCQREIKKLNAILGTSESEKTDRSFEQTKTINAELQNSKAELLNYKKKLFSALIELNELRQRNKQQKNTAEQIEDLMREKRILSEEYKLLQQKFTYLQKQKNKPDLGKQRLQNQLVEIKIKNNLLTQRLNLQKEKEKDLNEEMAILYRYKTKTKTDLQKLGSTIENLQYKVKKTNQLNALEIQKNLKNTNKIKSLETYNKQLAANLKDKDKEIAKLDGWMEQLRKKSGNQSEIQQEILKTNQLVNKEYKIAKKQNEKNIREIQQLNSLLRESNVAEVQLKKTLREINNQKETIYKEYMLLRKSYDHLLVVQSENTKEEKMLRGKLHKVEALVKTYSEKYEWAKKKLAARSNSDLQNIISLNKQIRLLNKKIDKKTVAGKSLEFELESIRNKHKNLKITLSSLRKSNKSLRVNERLLAQETQNGQILKRENIKLRASYKLLQTENAKVLAEKQKEYQDKIKKSEEKLLALQKQNQEMSDENIKLSIVSNEAVQLRGQLQLANKTINILRNSAGKNTSLAQKVRKDRRALGKYTPRMATPQPVNLKTLLADGIKAEKDDSDDVAIWNYRKYLASKPNNVEVNRRLGSILFKRNMIKEAADLLQKAYVFAPGNLNNASIYAQVLLKQKKFGNACAILQKATKKEPENYKLLTQYARARAGVGQSAAALDNLAVAIKLSPKTPQAYLARAQILAIYHPDLLDAAAKSYRKARNCGAKPDVFLEEILAKKLADNSEMIQFLQNPASEAERNKDWVSVAWYFGQLHKLKPGQKEYRDKLAAAFLLQNKYKKSLAALDLKNPSNNSRLIAASAELCRGNYSSANNYLKNAEQPNSMKVYFGAVKGYLKTLSSKARNKKKEFKQIYTELNKLL